jgi:tRNA pseudouridine32 synthase / 23S rRNA pseudouridine746 synthase
MMELSAEISMLYVDESLLVINKPAGISTLPDGYHPSLPHIKSLLEQQYGRLWIVHRLDKETSGVLLLARSAQAHRSLNTQFEQRLVNKAYHALVSGVPEWQEQTVNLPLRPNGDRQHRTVVDLASGKPADSRFKVLQRFAHHCLLEAIPETGRTHQIRAHLSAIGLYIIGDHLYKKPSGPPAEHGNPRTQPDPGPRLDILQGMALHAISLEFSHPLTAERMKFTAPYPEALRSVLAQLSSQYNE